MSRRVVLAATFAAEAVVPALSYWLARQQLDIELVLAPYGQVLEQVAAAGSELRREGTDLGVLLVRLEDYLRDEDAALRRGPDALELARSNVEELANALSGHAPGDGGVLVGVMPGTDGEVAGQLVEPGRQLLSGCVEEHPALSWLDLEGAMDLYSVREIGDRFRDEIAHIPFSEECLTAVATAVARQLRALWGPPCKVIALDCDNTLWRGACSEDPLGELDASGPFEYLRRFMHRQSSSGRLLCLVSRSPEPDVARAFALYGAPLTGDDVVARRCGWEAKPDSLRSIAAELDLDVGSFVFVDDDPVECAAVRDQLPEVSVIEVPRDPNRIPLTLEHAWELDIAFATEADPLRRRSYAANERMQTERGKAPDLATFVADLEVRVSLAPMVSKDVGRVTQLLQRTNQFNSTGRRVPEHELRELLGEPGARAWVVRVRDRLGDYGLVGALLCRLNGGMLRLDQVALSCRVFQRRVEHRMLAELVEAFEPRPAQVTVAYRDTGRNAPVRVWLKEMAAKEVSDGGDGISWFALS